MRLGVWHRGCMPRICLSMIVKDEESVIERCLDSVLPLVDMAVIVDTGSTDGTEAAIRRASEKHGKHIHVQFTEWRDYSYNRNQALEYAREILASSNGTNDWPDDYILVMDADDVLRPAPSLLELDGSDGYTAHYHLNDLTWGRVILCKAGVPWQYFYPVHEKLMRR